MNASASGANNGTSWADAYTDLQSALGASTCTEVWVKSGTYRPTSGTDRNATFKLKYGVALYGGFAGTETVRDQRNPALNITILSGEIGAPGISDNSYNVVYGATGATLDGFTITAGNDNTSYGFGGGMANFSSSPELTNVTFSDNHSTEDGGGMYNSSSNPTLTNVTFSGNSAVYGGGMYNKSSNPTLTNVTFSGNSAIFGGGMYNESSNPTLTNVTFSGNSAYNDYVNYSGGRGGGMNNVSSDPTLINVTFSGNTSGFLGGGMISNTGTPNIINSIFWGNTAETGEQFYIFSSLEISDSIVQDGCPEGGTCTNIITADPKLGTLGNHGGFTQTIPLLAGSSAIDTGNDDACPATDQRGVARPQGAHCDIGAYELDTTAPIVNFITRLNSSPTNLASVDFMVTFSKSVTGMDASDFTLSATDISGASVTAVSGSGSVRTVTVNTGTGTGTLRLDVPADAHVTDFDGNPLAGLPYTNGENYVVNKTAPTVKTFTLTTPSKSLNVPITAFSATDDMAVTGYLITTSSTPPAAGATGWTGTTPATYAVASDGSYTLYPWAKDAAGNVSAVFASPRAVVVDTTAPTVVSSVRADPNPTSATSVHFTVTFSESVTGVDASDFSLTTTGTLSSASVTGVSGSGATYTVTVSTGKGCGTLRLDIPVSATITDGADNTLSGLPYTGGEAYKIVCKFFLPLLSRDTP